MEAAAQRVLGLSRGRVALLPLVFFVLAALLAMVGPGAILSLALLAPMAIRTGVSVGISPFSALGAYLLFGGLGLSWRTAGSAQQCIPRLIRP